MNIDGTTHKSGRNKNMINEIPEHITVRTEIRDTVSSHQ